MPILFRETALLSFLLLPAIAQQTKGDPLQRAVAAMVATRRSGLCIVPPAYPDAPAPATSAAAAQALRKSFHQRLVALEMPIDELGDEEIEAVTPLATAGADFTTRLNHLLLTDDVLTTLLLDEAVLLVAPGEQVGGRPAETLVLFGADGRRIAGARADLGDEAAFVAAMEGLLHLVRKPQPSEAAKRVFAAVSTDELAYPFAAICHAEKPWRLVAPHVQRELAAATGIRRENLTMLARDTLMRVVSMDRRGLLPFGCEWQDETPFEHCVGCGMAMVGAPAKRLLKPTTR